MAVRRSFLLDGIAADRGPGLAIRSAKTINMFGIDFTVEIAWTTTNRGAFFEFELRQQLLRKQLLSFMFSVGVNFCCPASGVHYGNMKQLQSPIYQYTPFDELLASQRRYVATLATVQLALDEPLFSNRMDSILIEVVIDIIVPISTLDLELKPLGRCAVFNMNDDEICYMNADLVKIHTKGRFLVEFDKSNLYDDYDFQPIDINCANDWRDVLPLFFVLNGWPCILDGLSSAQLKIFASYIIRFECYNILASCRVVKKRKNSESTDELMELEKIIAIGRTTPLFYDIVFNFKSDKNPGSHDIGENILCGFKFKSRTVIREHRIEGYNGEALYVQPELHSVDTFGKFFECIVNGERRVGPSVTVKSSHVLINRSFRKKKITKHQAHFEFYDFRILDLTSKNVRSFTFQLASGEMLFVPMAVVNANCANVGRDISTYVFSPETSREAILNVIRYMVGMHPDEQSFLSIDTVIQSIRLAFKLGMHQVVQDIERKMCDSTRWKKHFIGITDEDLATLIMMIQESNSMQLLRLIAPRLVDANLARVVGEPNITQETFDLVTEAVTDHRFLYWEKFQGRIATDRHVDIGFDRQAMMEAVEEIEMHTAADKEYMEQISAVYKKSIAEDPFKRQYRQ